ncbi:hypothetical protein SEA_ITER_33 [Arthrobacter phage Iter]|uniref:DUF7455 domain-containing protein n=1 Tax=Arthrobacter phage Ascela TaxID=3038360 RepID=A0AAF0GHS7_9CAUD|nr:hypothetical protein SEA_ITER_33 [Arthrobacter phage Iter]WGH21556.1 hypothetical protein SEA_ASCELA_33 [Arthrobacter phage Ascela]
MNIPIETTPSEPTKVLVKTSNVAPATLTAADRCDKCGISSRAYVAVMLSVSHEGLLPLYFCAHHYAEYEPALRDRAVMTIDERWHLEASVKAQKEDVPKYLNTVTRGGI